MHSAFIQFSCAFGLYIKAWRPVQLSPTVVERMPPLGLISLKPSNKIIKSMMLTRTRLALSAWTMQIMYSTPSYIKELDINIIITADNVFGNNHLVLDASRAVWFREQQGCYEDSTKLGPFGFLVRLNLNKGHHQWACVWLRRKQSLAEGDGRPHQPLFQAAHARSDRWDRFLIGCNCYQWDCSIESHGSWGRHIAGYAYLRKILDRSYYQIRVSLSLSRW